MATVAGPGVGGGIAGAGVVAAGVELGVGLGKGAGGAGLRAGLSGGGSGDGGVGVGGGGGGGDGVAWEVNATAVVPGSVEAEASCCVEVGAADTAAVGEESAAVALVHPFSLLTAASAVDSGPDAESPAADVGIAGGAAVSGMRWVVVGRNTTLFVTVVLTG